MPAGGNDKAKDRGVEQRRQREILARCKSGRIQLVRFLYCGNDSVIRGKACHTRFLDSYLRSGIGLTVAMQSFNMLDQLVPEGSFGPVGEIRLVPDLETLAVLPYAPKSARLLCDMHTLEGEPWDACPRSFLKRMIERARQAGLTLKSSFENEFSLARREGEQYVPLDRSPCFSTIGMDSAAPVMMEIIEALVAQGVYPEQYYAELGPGQQELPVRFADALRAADNQLTVRETARGVALKHGLLASFAPKPFPDQAGNGSHVHWSLWRIKDGRNHLHDPRGRYGISEAGYAFIGGVLAHLPALVALTAPSVNSYRRLQPRFWSSAYTAWGPDNREAAVRVPSTRRGLEMESTNLELKPCDPSNNPYLALGGLLAAGLDGIERKLDPGEPALVDPDTLSDAERVRRGIRRLPTSLDAALDELERDEVLCAALGEALAKEYLVVKRSEARGFRGKDVAFEIEQHFYKY
ncbi:MAG TPA: glutamine synthetase family protein [Methylomirabilota bacterium]|jgi:glutamine synthetase|nr:glutamine synthetase family protein [Methylomirabilota bacterium]